MKNILAYMAISFIAELIVITIATLAGMSGPTHTIIISLLPIGLILGAVAYMAFKHLGKNGQETDR